MTDLKKFKRSSNMSKNFTHISYRINSDKVAEFRALSKELGLNQTAMITTAISKLIEDMKELIKKESKNEK